jgi:hypothetical protein
MRTVKTFLISSFVLAMFGCEDTAGPKQVPLQFQSFNPVTILETISITAQPSTIKVAGSYAAAACGSVGAVAVLNGSTLRLTVGPRRDSDICDAALVGYAYTAIIPGLESGRYTVEVFHRTNGGEAAKLAAHEEIVVR